MTHKEAVEDLNTIKEFFEQESGAYPVSLEYAIKVLKNVPSADRPQGEWIIEIDVNNNTYGRCSMCDMKQYAGQLNFCPNCGARMKGADDETD